MPEPQLPDLPVDWMRDRHKELEAHGLGNGFALFAKPGDAVRGYLRTFFKTKYGLAVSVELTQPPTASVFQTADEDDPVKLEPMGGDMVNVSLTGVDLERKLGRELRDKEVGIQYSHDTETRAGQMKQYRVVVFDSDLPVD